LLVAGLTVAAVPLASVAAPILSIEINPSPVTVGESFLVDVTITAATNLSGFRFDLSYDPVVTATAVTIGDFLPKLVVPGFGSLSPTIVEDGLTPEVSFAAVGGLGATGDGLLAQIAFNAVAAGTSELSLDNIRLSAPFGTEIPVGDVNNATVTVTADTPVPTPASGLLLAVGVAGLLACRRRRR
jgi:hypothetical protein